MISVAPAWLATKYVKEVSDSRSPSLSGVLGSRDWGNASKKEIRIGGEHHEPFEQYAPQSSTQITDARVISYPDYNINIDSPLARAGSKKDLTSEPEQESAMEGGATATTRSGPDMTIIGLALVGAGVGYAILKK